MIFKFTQCSYANIINCENIRLVNEIINSVIYFIEIKPYSINMAKVKKAITVPAILIFLLFAGSLTIWFWVPGSSMLKFFRNTLSHSRSIFLNLLLIWVLLCMLFIALYYYRKNKLHLVYGIYWDSKANAYCPTCQKPLHYNGLPYFTCDNCEREIYAFDLLGEFDAKTALKRIK